MQYVIPLVDGAYLESEVTQTGTRNNSNVHQIITAINGSPTTGKITIQGRTTGGRWTEIDYTLLSEVEPQKIKSTGQIDEYRFIVEGSPGTGSAIISDTELGESIQPYAFYGETNGMTPEEIGGAVRAGGQYTAEMPDGFNWPQNMPTPYVSVSGGAAYCNLSPSDFFDFSAITQTIYVDGDRASSGDGNSWNTAYNSLSLAILRQLTDVNIPTRIMVKGGVYNDAEGFGGSGGFNRAFTAPCAIVATNGRVVTSCHKDQTWTPNSTYTHIYETPQTDGVGYVHEAIDLYKKETPFVYKPVTSIADVAAESGTWYWDGAKIYVHQKEGGVVTNGNVWAQLNRANARIGGNVAVYMYGIDFLGGNTGTLQIGSGNAAVIVEESCRHFFGFSGSWNTPSSNNIHGVNLDNCGFYAAFNCEYSFNNNDGLNLTSATPYLAVHCEGHNNGLYWESSVSCNGLTSHMGCVGIDVGGHWTGSYGTQSGHVNDGTQYWGVGVVVENGDGDQMHIGGGIGFGGFGCKTGSPVAWLDGCYDTGCSVGLYADNTSATASMYYRNHKGTGDKVGGVQEY